MTLTFGEPTYNSAIRLSLSEYKHKVTFSELVVNVTSDPTWKDVYSKRRMHTMAMEEYMNQRIHGQRLYLEAYAERYKVLKDDFHTITAHLCNRFGYYTLPMVLQMLMENRYTMFLSDEYYPTFMRQENIDELTTTLKEVVCKHEQSVDAQLARAAKEVSTTTTEELITAREALEQARTRQYAIDTSALDAAGYLSMANVDVRLAIIIREDAIRRALEQLNLWGATQLVVTSTDTAPLFVTGDLWSSPIDGTSNNS